MLHTVCSVCHVGERISTMRNDFVDLNRNHCCQVHDADLRKLPLKDAKAILRKNGVPEEEIKKLSRQAFHVM